MKKTMYALWLRICFHKRRGLEAAKQCDMDVRSINCCSGTVMTQTLDPLLDLNYTRFSALSPNIITADSRRKFSPLLRELVLYEQQIAGP